jgi:hypothetical protein
MSRHPTPPALSSIASLCNTVSLTINELASSPYREPGFSLDAVDDEYGTAVVPDPLTNAHKLIRFFLLGAGDNLYAIGKLLDLPSPMLVSPAVLARATAEYSSRELRHPRPGSGTCRGCSSEGNRRLESGEPIVAEDQHTAVLSSAC